MIKIKGKYGTAVVYTNSAESSCLDQIKNMANSPAFNGNIKIMPDTHAGKGSVIGFTMPLGDKLVPATVGVDIGCGIYAYRISGELLEGEIDWKHIDSTIRKNIPLGILSRKSPLDIVNTMEKLSAKLSAQRHFSSLLTKLKLHEVATQQQIGTLGGGNHFIEISKSKNDGAYWLVIHTGSRNLGKHVCDYWQAIAIKRRDERIETIREYILNETPEKDREEKLKQLKEENKLYIPDDLCYLTGQDKEEYLEDMRIAQKYAHLNKRMIAQTIMNELKLVSDMAIETVHNYIDFSDNIIRKGAIRANKGEHVVIPLNMLAGTLLCVGKGNPEWNNSAPHGAGRKMSRGDAKRKITYEEYKKVMEPVWSTSVNSGSIDESPMAYKDPEEIKALLEPTCDIIDTLIPLYNLKDSNYKEK